MPMFIAFPFSLGMPGPDCEVGGDAFHIRRSRSWIYRASQHAGAGRSECLVPAISKQLIGVQIANPGSSKAMVANPRNVLCIVCDASQVRHSSLLHLAETIPIPSLCIRSVERWNQGRHAPFLSGSVRGSTKCWCDKLYEPVGPRLEFPATCLRDRVRPLKTT